MVNTLIYTISFAMKENEPLCNSAVKYKGTRKPANQWNSGHFLWRSPVVAGIENAKCLC